MEFTKFIIVFYLSSFRLTGENRNKIFLLSNASQSIQYAWKQHSRQHYWSLTPEKDSEKKIFCFNFWVLMLRYSRFCRPSHFWWAVEATIMICHQQQCFIHNLQVFFDFSRNFHEEIPIQSMVLNEMKIPCPGTHSSSIYLTGSKAINGTVFFFSEK